MKTLTIYQADAFTNKAFKGNPAVVCFLDEPIEYSIMQSIADEMNLLETAFVLPIDANNFSLRWFTPKVEVELCGHATLATSKVLFDEIKLPYAEIKYQTKSGELIAKKDNDYIILDFPKDEPIKFTPPDELLQAMGIKHFEDAIRGKSLKDAVIQLSTEKEITELNPNFEKMRIIKIEHSIRGVAITTRGTKGYDFNSRFFAPWSGINEDPVTGSIHTLLAPYWQNILNKSEFKAYQSSYRCGEMLLKIKGDRVYLIGQAITVSKGEIYF
jgi:PhzF family phenazine biosynthesis protein